LLPIRPGASVILVSYLFCHAGEVRRSKKRSRTTGHQHGEGRATSLKGRLATVRPRERPELRPLSVDEAHKHLKHTLAGSRWGVLRGWHVLRHWFSSACASRGIDQRLIDEWVGHTTEEMRRRFRHLIPEVKQQSVDAVFG
jgi:integrase